MTPYPFFPMLSVQDFVDRACNKYECKVVEYNEDSLLVRGELIVVIPNIEDGSFMPPDLLRNLCDRLEIPQADFGFTLRDDGLYIYSDTPEDLIFAVKSGKS